MNLNSSSLDIQQDSSESGYNPNIQVTTGTYCVTVFSSQSSDKPVSDSYSFQKDGYR